MNLNLIIKCTKLECEKYELANSEEKSKIDIFQFMMEQNPSKCINCESDFHKENDHRIFLIWYIHGKKLFKCYHRFRASNFLVFFKK